MLTLIQAGDAGLDGGAQDHGGMLDGQAKGALLPLASVKRQLLAPVPVPQQMRDFLAFELHYQASART